MPVKLVERKTGRIVDVPDKEAQAAFQSGQYGIPKGGALPVQVGTDVGTVSADRARQAFAQGAKVADERVYRAAEQEQRYGGVEGAAGAFGMGLARGAGLAVGVPTDEVALRFAGQSDHFRTEMDPYSGSTMSTPLARTRAGLTGLQEVNPYASGAGEMAGMAAAAALTGGGAMGGAGTLGEMAALELGASSKGFAVAAARAAGEGAFMSAVGAVNEAALGDYELTAEKLATSMTHGAVIGGGTGALLHVPGAALGAAKSGFSRLLASEETALERVAEKQFGYAPKGLGAAVREAYESAAAAASGGDVAAIRDIGIGNHSPQARKLRSEVFFEAPTILDNASREIRKAGDELMVASRDVTREAMGGLKESYVRKAVTTGNEAATASAVERHISEALAGAQGILESGGGYTKSVESLSTATYRTQAAIQAALETGGKDANSKIFMALDAYKRDAQKLTANAYQRLNAIADPIDHANARRTTEWLDKTAEGLRKSLENEELWGRAALDQQKINAAWSKQIDASKRFGRSMTTEIGRDPSNPYVKQWGMDPAKADTYVRNLTNPNQDLTHTAIRDYVSSTKDLTAAIGEAYELPAEKVAQVRATAEAAERFRATAESAAETTSRVNQVQSLLKAEGESGGLFGTMLAPIFKPGQTARQLAAAERVAARADKKLDLGIMRALDGATGGAAATESASTAILTGKGGERATFERSVAQLQEMSANPAKLSDRIAKTLGELGAAAPNVAGSFSATITRGVQYLTEHIPPGMAQDHEQLAPQFSKPLYSDSEMRSWARRAAAVNDPSTILDSMARGSLSPEEVDVMKNVYPKLYVETQTRIVTRLGEAKQQPARDQRMQLSLFFGVPADANMTPTVLAALLGPGKAPSGGGKGSTRGLGKSFSSNTFAASQRLGR